MLKLIVANHQAQDTQLVSDFKTFCFATNDIFCIYWIVIRIFFLFYCISLLPFTPLYPPPHVITTLLSLSMSPFSFLFYPSSPTPPNSCHPSLYSKGLSLFCLLVQFVHYFPHISEILWHLLFLDCLISLSTMLSRSIHAVAKGKIFFFFL